MRLRLVVRILTQLVTLIQAIIGAIARKRKAKAAGAGIHPTTATLEITPIRVAEELRQTVPDGLVSRTEVLDVASGHTFEIWEIGRWGADQSRVEVLGRGGTLEDAAKDWRRGQTRTARRRWSGHG